ncbi:lysophospholipid acyltransferase family protein [Tundrisphaera sp. TA3]|uniref:lysophospholipid acyltransferase family protein n=1 Tax=Tundrisphaera sp. TA3 TaxID=3435775 RepID=UPI003EB73125
MNAAVPTESAPSPPRPAGRRAAPAPAADRSRASVLWYRMVQWFFSTLLAATYSLRATGRENLPESGAVMLVSNHLSHLDVLVLGILLRRPLNYVARSTLFFPPLGLFIRSLGAFPIQRDGIGAQGLKETLKRLKSGGIVTLFPEGTRTEDGDLGEMKAGIALLATRAKVAIVPAAVAGTFEAWPKTRFFPVPHPLRVHFGDLIPAEQVVSMSGDDLNALIRTRVLECQRIARRGIARDLDLPETAVGDPDDLV